MNILIVLVKELTYGGTLANCWYCINGSFFATLASWTAIEIIYSNSSISYYDTFPLALFFQLILVFCYQYLELPIMAKRLSISIIVLNLISPSPRDAKAIWGQFCSVLLGCAVGLVGTLFPFPIIASREVRERINYGTHCVSSLLEDSIRFWLLLPFSSATDDRINDSAMSAHVILHHDRFSWSSRSDSVHCRNKYWVKLRLIVRVLSLWKRLKCSGIGFAQRPYNRSGHFLRLEVVSYLENSLRVVTARQLEARFGPNREHVIFQYDKYVKLMQDLLLIVNAMENFIDSMNCTPEASAVYQAYFSRPEFRKKLFLLIENVKVSLASISASLLHMHEQRDTQSELSYRIIRALSCMLRARDSFDEEYFRCRRVLYYGECEIDSTSQGTSKKRSRDTVPFNSDVVLQMNSFLFLVDTICQLIVTFVSFDDMIGIASTVGGGNALEHKMDVTRTVKALIVDLFPPQSHLFKWIQCGVHCSIPPAIVTRLRMSVSVAASMVIAGVYGFYGARPQPALAAFTISFLAGGPAAGASIVTSLNRSFGTVVASVYCILVVFIIRTWESEAAKNVFILFAVTIFQLPATYVRTFPISGYAGTVAGFTVPILLLSSHAGTQEAVDRIIDTYVGVAIYLLVELSCNARFTETILLENVGVAFEGFTDLFRQFFNNLDSFLESSLDSDRVKASASSPRPPVASFGALRGMIEQQRTMIMFSAAEPSVFRPPPFPRQFYEEIVARQEEALRNLQIMSWAVAKPSDWFCFKNKEVAIHQLTKFLQDSGDDSTGGVDARRAINSELQELKRASKAAPEELMHSVQGSGFEIIVEAIRPHYVEVYQSLSVTMRNLTGVLETIRCRSHVAATRQTSFAKMMSLPESVQRGRASAYLASWQEDDGNENDDTDDLLLPPNKMRAIVENYYDLIVNIRNSVMKQRSDSSPDLLGDSGSGSRSDASADLSGVMSNREIKVITAVVAGTRELLGALEGLLSVVHRMRAHRVLHTGQDGRTLGK